MESLTDGGKDVVHSGMTILNEYDQDLRNKMDSAGVLRKTYETEPVRLGDKLYFKWFWYPGGSGTEKIPIWVESDYSVRKRIVLNDNFTSEHTAVTQDSRYTKTD
jgi:hypothetical protein